jgi:hypothetical protein
MNGLLAGDQKINSISCIALHAVSTKVILLVLMGLNTVLTIQHVVA